MHQLTKAKLTIEILNSISAKEIIYAESASGGAMGNSGGIMIYIIRNKELILYETSVFTDEITYDAAQIFLRQHQIDNKYEGVEPKEIIFQLVYGGMGNLAFINKNVSLDTDERYVLYTENNTKYYISSSVPGVFDRVVNAIQNFMNKDS